jgi:hypothetical protein
MLTFLMFCLQPPAKLTSFACGCSRIPNKSCLFQPRCVLCSVMNFVVSCVESFGAFKTSQIITQLHHSSLLLWTTNELSSMSKILMLFWCDTESRCSLTERLIKRAWIENQETILWSLQRKPKIHDRSSKLQNHTAIGGRSALDLRAEVGVWCMMVWPFDEKMLSPLQLWFNFNSQWSLIALCDMQAALLAQIQLVCSASGNTLCFCRDSRSMYV